MLFEPIMSWRPADPGPIGAQRIADGPYVGWDDERKFKGSVVRYYGDSHFEWYLYEMDGDNQKLIANGVAYSVAQARLDVERSLEAHLRES